MKTLVDSSFETREWVRQIHEAVDEQHLPVRYHDTVYWACFESQATGRNFAYLHPQKNQARLFLAVPHEFDRTLRESPSTEHWKWHLPSLYVITGPHVFVHAVKFICASYEFDRMLSEARGT